MMKRQKVWFAVLCLILLTAARTGLSTQQDWKKDLREENRLRLRVNRKALPYTRRLPAVDKVVLILISSISEGGQIRSIAASKIVEGRVAKSVASTWRLQSFDFNYSADCHEPQYAIKFFAAGKVVLYASICWDCRNVVFLEPIVGRQGFHANGRSGKALLHVFTAAFPAQNHLQIG